jgi:hypothetical protein
MRLHFFRKNHALNDLHQASLFSFSLQHPLSDDRPWAVPETEL